MDDNDTFHYDDDNNFSTICNHCINVSIIGKVYFSVYRLEEDVSLPKEDDDTRGFNCRGTCSPADEATHSIRW